MAPPATERRLFPQQRFVRLPDSLRVPPYAVSNTDLVYLTSATEALLHCVSQIYTDDNNEDDDEEGEEEEKDNV
jgi:hypothetical protein